MDRIELKDKDVVALFAWKDEHKDLVRTMPAPLKAIELVFVDTNLRLVGIRTGSFLKLTLSESYKRIWSKDFSIDSSGLVLLKSRGAEMEEADVYSAITAYCAVMALMTYGNAFVEESPEELHQPVYQKTLKKQKKTASKRSKRVTYILHSAKGALTVAHKGSHASPSGIFTVRGHWRHLKNGQVIWISEFKKGTGKKKRKTYKTGLKGENESE